MKILYLAYSHEKVAHAKLCEDIIYVSLWSYVSVDVFTLFAANASIFFVNKKKKKKLLIFIWRFGIFLNLSWIMI